MSNYYGPQIYPHQREHVGAREGNADYFDDAQMSEVAGNSLGASEGMVDLMTPKVQYTPKGYLVVFRCDYCSHSFAPLTPWSELLFIAHGLNPADPTNQRAFGRPPHFQATSNWMQNPNNQEWIPDFGHNCGKGRQNVSISQSEAGKVLQWGLANNLVNSSQDSDPAWARAATLMNAINRQLGVNKQFNVR